MPHRSSRRKKRGLLRRYAAFLRDANRHPAGRIAATLAGLFFLFAAVLLAVLLVLVPLTPSVSSLKQAKVQRPAVVKAAGGEVLTEFRRLNREWVALSEINPSVVQALVATEDHRFYAHPGVDVWRLVGALGRTLLGSRQGGSTLDMQLARNLYPAQVGQAAAPVRKLKEIVTAFKIEAVYDKDEILETYLNTMPFLYGVVGIELAAQTYFGKSAKALSAREAATLVGMLKATSYYNPKRHPERAQRRRNVVLSQMKKRSVLSAAQYEALSKAPLGLDFHPQPRRRPSRAPHFTEHVRRQLQAWAEERGLDLLSAGLVVHTTLDLGLQEMAETAAERQGRALQTVADVEWSTPSSQLLSTRTAAYENVQPHRTAFGHFWQSEDAFVNAFIRATERFRRSLEAGVSTEETLRRLRADGAFMDSLRTAKTRLETGFVALDPRTGGVRAWVGSRDFSQGPFDHVAAAKRQPGSTFKPFVYAAALEDGIRPGDTYRDAPVEIALGGDRVWKPVNAGGETSGEAVTVREGLEQSKNTITAQLMQEVGPRHVARVAQRLGVRESRLNEVPSLALGTSSVTLLEMTSAYSTLAAGGVYHAPRLLTRIEDHDGNVLASFAPPPDRVMDEDVALTLLDIMRGVIDRGTGRGVRSRFGVRADVAGKTGTTQGGADGWFLLMHPQLVAGAWVGFDDPRVTFRSNYWGQGAHNALFVVGDFFRQALRQGALSPQSAFERIPDEPPQGPSFLGRMGRALADAASWVGDQLKEAGRAVGGWFDGEDAPAPSPAESPPPRVASDEESEETLEEEAFEEETTAERRTRLERYWREVQEERRQRMERYREEAGAAPPGWTSGAGSADTTTGDGGRIGW